MILLPLLSLGCTQYLIELEQEVPDPPPLVQAAPRLSQLSVSPSSLAPGRFTTITVRFRYEDWNEDVGPDQAKVQRHLEVLSGNLAFYNPTREFWVDIDDRGRQGFVRFQLRFYIPGRGYGEFRLSLSLYDRRANKSAPISAVLAVR